MISKRNKIWDRCCFRVKIRQISAILKRHSNGSNVKNSTFYVSDILFVFQQVIIVQKYGPK